MYVLEANRDLQRAMGFTDEDLAANRAGNLTSHQRAKLSRDGKVQIVLLGILLPIAVVVIRFLIGWNLSIITLLWFGLLWLYVFEQWRNRNKDLSESSVLVVEGAIRCNKTHDSGDGEHLIFPNHYLLVDNIKFKVNKQVYRAFSDGMYYRLYYLPRTKKILSAEWRV